MDPSISNKRKCLQCTQRWIWQRHLILTLGNAIVRCQQYGGLQQLCSFQRKHVCSYFLRHNLRMKHMFIFLFHLRYNFPLPLPMGSDLHFLKLTSVIILFIFIAYVKSKLGDQGGILIRVTYLTCQSNREFRSDAKKMKDN